jgi:hypothetical protein
MTCPEFQLSKNGRAGIGVVQPQSGLDYPLIAPSSDIRYLIADLHLSYDDSGEYDKNVAPAQHPLKIKYLYGAGCLDNTPSANFPAPEHTVDIVVVDATDRIILDTTTQTNSFNAQNWGDDYTIYEWKAAHAVCRMVLYTTWPNNDNEQTDDDTPRQYNKFLTPENATLDERAVYKMPRRLLTLRVRNGQTTTPRYSGNFKLSNEYNTEINALPGETKNFRNITRINFSAVPGTGLGRYGACPDGAAVPILKINGLESVNGDLSLAGTDCLWLRRPVTTDLVAPYPVRPSSTAQQQIGADCEPCCGCDDYADTAKYMNDTSYRYKLIGQRAEKVRSEHENNIARWRDQRACSVQRPLRLLLVPQRCPYLDIVMLLCNPCEECINPALLTVTLNVSGDFVPADPSTQTAVAIRPTLECGYTAMYAPGINGGAVGLNVNNNGLQYSVAFPQLKSGASAYVQFRVKFNQYDPATGLDTETRARGPYIVSGLLTGTYLASGQPLLTNCGQLIDGDQLPPAAIAEAVQTLHCTSDGTTEAPC